MDSAITALHTAFNDATRHSMSKPVTVMAQTTVVDGDGDEAQPVTLSFSVDVEPGASPVAAPEPKATAVPHGTDTAQPAQPPNPPQPTTASAVAAPTAPAPAATATTTTATTARTGSLADTAASAELPLGSRLKHIAQVGALNVAIAVGLRTGLFVILAAQPGPVSATELAASAGLGER